MPAKKDLTGMRFGRLTVVSQAEPYINPNGRHYTMWNCICDCGNTKTTYTSNLTLGLTQSCGCLQRQKAIEANIEHGDADSRLYNVWCAIKRRCFNPDVPEYRLYGGRGITMCDEWKNSYSAFKEWAYQAGYDPNAPRGVCTIDRIDVNGDYCPENCRWVTAREQMNNIRNNHRITYNGITHTVAEWTRVLNVTYSMLSQHIRRKTQEQAPDVIAKIISDNGIIL